MSSMKSASESYVREALESLLTISYPTDFQKIVGVSKSTLDTLWKEVAAYAIEERPTRTRTYKRYAYFFDHHRVLIFTSTDGGNDIFLILTFLRSRQGVALFDNSYGSEWEKDYSC